MAKNQIRSEVILTPEFRVGFPHIWEPTDNGKYGLAMLFDKETFDATPFKEIAKEVLSQVQAAVYKGQPIPNGVRKLPIKDGDEINKAGNKPYPGYYAINTTSRFQPGIVDAKVQPILDQSEFYAGCYARAKVHAYWYSVDGNSGVGICIGNVQKTRDGERFGGGRAATEDFDVYVDKSANSTSQNINDIMDL